MILVLLLAFCCFALTGLIWTIQLVHYPSFLWVDKSQFVKFEAFHSQRISIIVIPLMLIELALSFYFVINPFKELDTFFIIHLLGVLLIWVSTFLLSVPCHNRLNQSYNTDVIHKLILTNWPRTLLWSLRSIALIGLLMHAFLGEK